VGTIEQGQRALRTPVQETRAKARGGRGWYAVVARTGLVAKGISYGLVGALAVKLAFGDGGKATSRQGALHALAQHSFGRIVLILLVGGFLAYALWRVIQAVAERSDDEDSAWKAWGKRAGYLGRAAIYAGLTWSAIKILSGAGNRPQNQKAHEWTARVLGWPAGTWLVAAAGLTILGVGLWNVYRGISQNFEDKWRVVRLSPAARKWGARAGTAGHLARGLVFGLIGVFVTKAALDFKPTDAIGLDGALQKLIQAPYGPWLLGVTAVGLVAYGVFCLVDARLRDVSA